MLEIASALGRGEYVSITLEQWQKIEQYGHDNKKIQLQQNTTFRIVDLFIDYNHKSGLVIEKNGRQYLVNLGSIMDSSPFANNKPFTIDKIVFNSNKEASVAAKTATEVDTHSNMHPISAEEATSDVAATSALRNFATPLGESSDVIKTRLQESAVLSSFEKDHTSPSFEELANYIYDISILKAKGIDTTNIINDDTLFEMKAEVKQRMLTNLQNNSRHKLYDSNSGKTGVNQSIVMHAFSRFNTKLISDMINQVKEKYPGISTYMALRFLKSMECSTFSVGLCSYADVCNAIYEYYLNMDNGIERFEHDFGFAMYKDGKLNDAELLLDMYLSISGDVLIKKNSSGKYVSNITNMKQLFMTKYLSSTDIYEVSYLTDYLKQKGIIIDESNITQRQIYNSKTNLAVTEKTNHEELSVGIGDQLRAIIFNAIENGEHVSISSNYGLRMSNDAAVMKILSGPHIMSIYGIDVEGTIIVDSWGERYYIDLDQAVKDGIEFTIDALTLNLESGAKTVNSNTNTTTNMHPISAEEARANPASNYQVTYNGVNYNLGIFVSDFQTNIDYYGISMLRNGTFKYQPMYIILNDLARARDNGIEFYVDDRTNRILNAISTAHSMGGELLNYADVYMGNGPIYISRDIMHQFDSKLVLNTIQDINNNTYATSIASINLLLELSKSDIRAIKYIPVDYLVKNISSIRSQYKHIDMAFSTNNTDNQILKQVLDADVAKKLGINNISKSQGMITQIFNRHKSFSEEAANIQLKNEILDKVKYIRDSVVLARAIYIELNKRIHYDYTYHFGDKNATVENVLDKYHRQELNFENINDTRSMVCMEWAHLYRELLLAAGFDENKVEVKGLINEQEQDIADRISHHWVTIKIRDNLYIIADGTNSYTPLKIDIDIVKAKLGQPLLQFILVDEALKDRTINSLLENWQKQGIDIERTIYENKDLNEIDKKIGYRSESGYISEDLARAKDLFAPLGKKINKSNHKATVNKIETILEGKLPEIMNGHEARRYYESIFDNIGLKVNVDYMWKVLWTNPQNIEPIFVLIYQDINGWTKYFLYSQLRGKTYMTPEEYQRFYQTLKIAKEWSSDN